MINSEFICPDSFILRRDPRVKIVIVTFFSVLTATINSPSVLAFSLALSSSIAFWAKVPPVEALKRLLPVNTMIIFLGIMLPFTVKGSTWFSLGPLTASYEGAIQALTIALKGNAIMVLFITLTSTTSVITVGQAMLRLGMPPKLVHLFFFTYRYIHVIFREYSKLRNTMRIRGFVPGTNSHTYKTYAYMVGMILVRSSERAGRVYRAMVCRGFNGNFYSLDNLKVTKGDIISLTFSSTFLIIMGYFEWIN